MVEVEGRAIEVVFFEDRAQVTRRAEVDLNEGITEVSIGGLSLLTDDSTVVARVIDGGEVKTLTSRVRRVRENVREMSEEEIGHLTREVRTSWVAREELRRQLTRFERELHRTRRLEGQFLDAMGDVPGTADAEQWRDGLGRLGQRQMELVGAIHDARGRADRLEEALDLARERLARARVSHPQVNARAEIQFECTSARRAEVEVSYYVPCALWRPSHLARLSADRATLRFTMSGTVWHATGERWENVRCVFSTARPTRASEAPTIDDDVLRARPKTEYERQVVEVQARDVDISSTGSERSGAVEQMPGVDDGGEPLRLTSLDTVTIPGTGEPFRVPFASHEVPCEAGLVAIPEKSTVPFLRVRGTWDGDQPLLAGPVTVMRGNEYAGRSRVDFVAPGANFEVGLGSDGAVSVHRSVDDEHKTTRVTGKNILNREVRVALSNLSGQKQHLAVLERVPVSELEEVDVRDLVTAMPPDEDGFVEFGVELAPHEVRTLTIGYRVEYGSRVRLSW